jgi:hypothetical protein
MYLIRCGDPPRLHCFSPSCVIPLRSVVCCCCTVLKYSALHRTPPFDSVLNCHPYAVTVRYTASHELISDPFTNHLAHSIRMTNISPVLSPSLFSSSLSLSLPLLLFSLSFPGRYSILQKPYFRHSDREIQHRRHHLRDVRCGWTEKRKEEMDSLF